MQIDHIQVWWTVFQSCCLILNRIGYFIIYFSLLYVYEDALDIDVYPRPSLLEWYGATNSTNISSNFQHTYTVLYYFYFPQKDIYQSISQRKSSKLRPADENGEQDGDNDPLYPFSQYERRR